MFACESSTRVLVADKCGSETCIVCKGSRTGKTYVPEFMRLQMVRKLVFFLGRRALGRHVWPKAKNTELYLLTVAFLWWDIWCGLDPGLIRTNQRRAWKLMYTCTISRDLLSNPLDLLMLFFDLRLHSSVIFMKGHISRVGFYRVHLGLTTYSLDFRAVRRHGWSMDDKMWYKNQSWSLIIMGSLSCRRLRPDSWRLYDTNSCLWLELYFASVYAVENGRKWCMRFGEWDRSH